MKLGSINAKEEIKTKRMFRSMTTAMSARNLYSNHKNNKFNALNTSNHNMSYRESSQTRMCRSRMCLKQIQEREKSQSKKSQRNNSVTLKSLERERFYAKLNRKNKQGLRDKPHENSFRGLASEAYNSNTIDQKYYDSRTSLDRVLKKQESMDEQKEVKEIRLGKQPKNSYGLHGHTFDNSSSKFLNLSKVDHDDSINPMEYQSNRKGNTNLSRDHSQAVIDKYNDFKVAANLSTNRTIKR